MSPRGPYVMPHLVIMAAGTGGHIIPVVNRPRVKATVNKLNAPLSGWDNDTWSLGFWSRDS